MEATKEEQNTVADVAKVSVDVQENNAEKTLALVKALIEEGAQVQVTIHYAEAQAPMERFETIEIGEAKWRRSIQLPSSMPAAEQYKIIEEKALAAARAYAVASAAAKGA